MRNSEILKRFVCVLLVLTLVSNFFVVLPLSVFAETEGGTLEGGQSNIVNGGFEIPDTYRIDALASNSASGYKYAPQGEVDGWNTTSTSSSIEIGWLNKDGSSPYMVPTYKTEIVSGVGASNGWQFAEVIGNEAYSSLYQSIPLSVDKTYNWSVHHRGRYGVDTLACIIADDVGLSSYVKPSKSDKDHFQKVLEWLKSIGTTAPDSGNMAEYTVYTTTPIDSSSFEGEESNWFSLVSDENHPVEFKVYLLTSEKADWNKFTGSYTSNKDKNILFALSPFSISDKSGKPTNVITTSGNLIDNMSFTLAGSSKNMLENPGFDTPELSNSSGYAMANAANSASPLSGIGWSTTATDYKVEIGILSSGKDAYGLGVTFDTVTYNAPSVREGEQFAELNADQESSLYQVVDTVPGKMYKWSLSHRGRSGLDTMALIIGPNQEYAPKKTSSTARDQFMQIVDWLYSQTEVPLALPKNGGCSDKIKLYSVKFNSNGGWETSDNVFSFYKDAAHTEEWSVWIISSQNDTWHDYGELDDSATYSYDCVIPKDQEKTIFGFVSHESTNTTQTKDNTYGNLLDNIAFKEYYYAKVEVAMNNQHGTAHITYDDEESFIFDDKSQLNGWALRGSNVTVHVKPDGRVFIGAYINGVFYPNTEDENDIWEYNAETGEYYHTFSDIDSAVKVNIIFSAQQIYYDSRSNYEYYHDPDDINSGPEVQMSLENDTYTSRAPQADDGWQFMGWKYISPADSTATVFDAVHTITLVGDGSDGNPQTFTVTDAGGNKIENIPYDEGITFLGEWKYRQRAIAQTFDKDASQYITNTEGGTVNITVSYGNEEAVSDYIEDGNAVGRELYAYSDDTYVTVTAQRNTGFTFSGWYDSDGNLVSKNTNYVYMVQSQKTQQLYARFDPMGYNLVLDCSTFGDTEDADKYFKIYCSFTGLRENGLYTITDLVTNLTFDGERVTNPATLNADENGKASITVYMKHSDCAKFIYLPENCIYTIQADDESAEGFSVRGEVSSKMLRAPDEGTTVNEHIIFYKASQTSLIKENEWYNGITDSSDPLLITKNSSFTLQVETKYTPNIYEDLSASLYFYNSDGISTDFVDKTRILMIDMTDEQNPGYYSYIVNGSVSEIPLTEFTELSTADDKFSLKTGDMFTEKLIFAVDYVGSEDSARSGKYSLVYNDAANELKEATNPAKKTVNIGEDTTSLTAAGNSDKAAAIGPFEINIAISDSRPAVNTTYKESEQSKYAVNLSVENAALPDGAYVLIGGKKYYTDNGYIKISPLTEGEYTFKIYSPVPIELTDGKVTFNVDLLSAVSTSPAIPEKITKTVTFNCVDVALDADITDKVLNPGEVSQMDATLKYVGLDAVKLTVTKKGNDTPIISDYNIPLPASGGNVTLSAENGFSFTAVSGETYIFTFVGYSGGVAVLEDKCCVVGGYIVT